MRQDVWLTTTTRPPHLADPLHSSWCACATPPLHFRRLVWWPRRVHHSCGRADGHSLAHLTLSLHTRTHTQSQTALIIINTAMNGLPPPSPLVSRRVAQFSAVVRRGACKSMGQYESLAKHCRAHARRDAGAICLSCTPLTSSSRFAGPYLISPSCDT